MNQRAIITVTPFRPQQGAVLIVCLVLLLILTMLGLSSVGNVNLQTQMARNTQFSQEVYQFLQGEMKYQMERIQYDANNSGGLDPFHNSIVAAGVNNVQPLPGQLVGFDMLALAQGINMSLTITLAEDPDDPAALHQTVPGCGNSIQPYKFRISGNATITGTPFGSNQEVGYIVCPP